MPLSVGSSAPAPRAPNALADPALEFRLGSGSPTEVAVLRSPPRQYTARSGLMGDIDSLLDEGVGILRHAP
jgi:hypothetical protein